jgi:uncharacterized protein YecE (DUF72 family)
MPTMEFRHASWHSDDTYEVLRRFGVALCIADSDERTTPFEVTAPFGYFRLRRAAYEEHTLREWADRIAAAGWENAFVYFKHEERGTGPRFAEQFRTMAVPEGAST